MGELEEKIGKAVQVRRWDFSAAWSKEPAMEECIPTCHERALSVSPVTPLLEVIPRLGPIIA